MLRDELLSHLLALPAGADVVIRLGRAHIEIAGISASMGEPGAMLLPHLPDVRDVFHEHGVSATSLLADGD